MSLLNSLQEMIGERGLSQIAQKIGGDEQSVEKAVSAALPTLVGAMGRQADSGDGQNLLNGFFKDDDDSPDDAHDFFQNNHHESQDANPLLDGLFGSKRNKIEDGIGQVSGLSSKQTGGLMKMLAPLIMSYMAKQAFGKKNQPAPSGGGSIFDIIKGAGREAEEESKQKSGGLIGRMLDQDGDGDFDFSDVAKVGFSFLRGKK